MKKSCFFLLLLLTPCTTTFGQENRDMHLLDGTSMNYYYSNGSAVHVSFDEGNFNYKWLAGPLKDAEGREAYRSRKVGQGMYLVNFMVQATKTFVTILFNFDAGVMYTSALFTPGTEQEMQFFEGGIIEQLTLVTP